MEIKKIAWCDHHDSILVQVLEEDLNAIKAEVESGASELWEVDGHGLTITRIEPDENGNPYELVFVAGVGRNAHKVIEYFRQLAKDKGLKKMRIHSKRKGMGKYLEPLGFWTAETVYKAAI